jgi:hypothetical protein
MGKRFELRYGVFRWLLSVFGMGPRFSYVAIGDDALRVRMGWCFRASIPRSSITGVRRNKDMWWGIGVHGGRGRWLVNGSVRGIVTIDIHPRAPARVMGWRVRLRELHVSLTDPDGFVAALASRPA